MGISFDVFMLPEPSLADLDRFGGLAGAWFGSAGLNAAAGVGRRRLGVRTGEIRLECCCRCESVATDADSQYHAANP